MGRRCVAPYPTRPTRPLEHSHCRAKPTRTVRVHCEHILMWSECNGRTRRNGRCVYTGNPTRTVRERCARRVKLPVCTQPYSLLPEVFGTPSKQCANDTAVIATDDVLGTTELALTSIRYPNKMLCFMLDGIFARHILRNTVAKSVIRHWHGLN